MRTTKHRDEFGREKLKFVSIRGDYSCRYKCNYLRMISHLIIYVSKSTRTLIFRNICSVSLNTDLLEYLIVYMYVEVVCNFSIATYSIYINIEQFKYTVDSTRII